MKTRIKSVASIFGMSFIALGSAGCVSLLPEPAPAPKLYRLLPPPPVPMETQTETVVMVGSLATSKTLSSNDIIVSYDNETLASVEGAKWVEALPGLLQSAIVDQLNAQPGLAAVTPSDRVRSPYRLAIELREFEARFDQGQNSAPLAAVRMTTTLTQSDDRKLLGRKTFSATARAETTNVSEVVYAQRRASEDAMLALAKWVASELTTRMSSN